MSWFWESKVERLERERREAERRREAELLTGKWEGRYSYRLPITGDVINTTRIYAIQVEGKVVIVRTWNDPLTIPCASSEQAETVRGNIAHIIDAVRGGSDCWGGGGGY